MKIVQLEKEGVICLKIDGRLDAESAPEAETTVKGILKGGTQRLLFDLSQMDYISSAGLRVFSTARKQLKARGGQTSFVNMQPQIQEVFAIMESLPGVAVFKDVAELDRYLAVRQRKHQEDR